MSGVLGQLGAVAVEHHDTFLQVGSPPCEMLGAILNNMCGKKNTEAGMQHARVAGGLPSIAMTMQACDA